MEGMDMCPIVTQCCSAPTPGVGRGTSRAAACFSCYARLSGVLYDQQVIIGLFRVEGRILETLVRRCITIKRKDRVT
jgi:hypothetical protein